MPGGTGKVLGPEGADVFDGDRLSASARRKFTQDCASIMAAGNKDGTGLLATGFLPIPVYPVTGPKVILNPIIKPAGENLFWFDPDPLAAAAVLPVLLDPKSEFQKIFVDGIYEPLMKMLNQPGAPSLGPVFDPTIFCDISKPAFKDLTIPKIPEILAKIVINSPLYAVPATKAPALAILVGDLGIASPDVTIISTIIPLLAAPPIPPLPPIPPVPAPPSPKVGLADPSFFLDFTLGIFKAPLIIFPDVVSAVISVAPTPDPPTLLKKIIGLIVDVLLGVIKGIGLLVGIPKLLLSFLMVIVKNMAVALLCMVVGKLLGTGAIVKIIGKVGGLA